MKNLWIIVFTAFCSVAFGQDTKVSLNDLYIPNAPGLILGDKSPASIDKPSTPRAFAVSLINLSEGGAVEVTPYWFKNKPRYTYDAWVKKTFMLVESFNISIATYKTNNTFSFAPGIRTQVFRIYSRKTREKLLEKKQEIVQLLGTMPLDVTAINSKKKELDNIGVRGLFSLDMAGAILGSSTNNSFKSLDLDKSGIWTNIRWAPASFPLGVVGLSRYSWSNNKGNTVKDSRFLDFGASLNYMEQKLDLSAEYVSRRDYTVSKSYSRIAFVANYAITENIIIVASSGKNFTDVNNIVTLFGVKFGVSGNKAQL